MGGINWLKLVASILVCFLAAGIGGYFTAQSIPTWYAALEKPSFSPPNWVFGPVWTLLYLLMGISAYLVWERGLGARGVKKALGVFGLQLVLNALWSIAFFGMRSPIAGFAVIVALWATILFTILEFRKVDKMAWWLLAPYILWVSFAAFLNFSIVMLNP